ncbi:unnamed protein product [Orchesella dallaii]|uniref:Uncharacterized protein n=1 Tax=Orchesella dallaii TaxID=48710 RepID=A0ABP1R6H5_9HEXA
MHQTYFFMWFCFTNVLSLEPDEYCISNVFPHLNREWEQYVLYFHNVVPFPTFYPSANLLTGFSLQRSENAKITVGVYRFSNPFNIIISPLSTKTPAQSASNTVFKFIDVLIPSRSLYIFVIVDNGDIALRKQNQNDVPLWISQALPVFPALKAVINIPSSRITSKSVAQSTITFICNSYCETNPMKLQNSDFLASNIYSIHRTLYRNANLKFLPGLARDIFDYVNTAPYLNFCFTVIKSLEPICRSDIMSILILAVVHNSSLYLVAGTPSNNAQYQVSEHYGSVEHIVHSMFYFSYNIPVSTLNKLTFERYDSNVLFYCHRKNNNVFSGASEFTFWYQPFTPGIWMGILSIMITSIFYFNIDQNISTAVVSILHLVSSAFGQTNWELRRYMIVVCALAFMCSVYGNSILSIITVVLPPKGADSLKELLTAGYRIIFFTQHAFRLPKEIFRFDFLQLHLSKFLDHVFYIVNNTGLISDIIPTMAEKGNKFAAIHFASISTLILKDISHKIQLLDPEFICFQLEQQLNPKIYFWKINTENSFWIRKSLGQIMESGLYFQWDAWSTWRYLLKLKQLGDLIEHLEPEYINLQRFRPIISICAGLLIVCIAVFVFEICTIYSRKKSTVRKSSFKQTQIILIQVVPAQKE